MSLGLSPSLARRHRSLSVGMPLAILLIYRILWAKQVGLDIRLQERLDHDLCLWPEIDQPLFSVVLSLV